MPFLSFSQIIEEKCAKIKKNYGFGGKVKSALSNQIGLCKADDSLVFLVWLLAVMCLPHTFRNLHVGKDCGEGRFFGRAGIDSEADFLAASLHVADAHLTEIGSVGGTFDAIVIFSARESVPHGLDIGGDGRCGPVGIAAIGGHAAKMLELVVLVFYRAFQPVLAVQIHHNAALVKALVALCEVGLDNKTEELFARLHLQHWRIVVLEVVVSALPQVGVRGGGDEDGVALYLKASRLSCPLKAVYVDASAV